LAEYIIIDIICNNQYYNINNVVLNPTSRGWGPLTSCKCTSTSRITSSLNYAAVTIDSTCTKTGINLDIIDRRRALLRKNRGSKGYCSSVSSLEGIEGTSLAVTGYI
jgi:hypothetical protein